MLVRATDKYEKLNVQDEKLKKIPKEGEQFEVSEDRYIVLKGNNKYNEVFVEKIEEKIEIAKKEIKSEKAVKKVNKKTK